GYFQSLHQAKFTPPSWAFAPAWTLNNFCTIYGLLRVLNKPQASQGRSEYLALQGVSWINFVIFNAAYFSLRSPLNALALTLSMLALTIASSLIALLRLKDTWVALSLATLFLWLIVASSAALFQAAWNKDEFYQAGPFLHPVPTLEK
ncbi:MAG TPA: TspO/MBR family protein, partial [Ktedonobacteraceae bacterium]|nr:TspO/MBR family protein [Ktedonobacteraceae bacterium]